MHECEDGGGRADPERQRKDRGCGESRSLQELPDRVADILQNVHDFAPSRLIRVAFCDSSRKIDPGICLASTQLLSVTNSIEKVFVGESAGGLLGGAKRGPRSRPLFQFRGLLLIRRGGCSGRIRCLIGWLDGKQFDLEDQGRIRSDIGSRAPLTVSKIRRNEELPL